MSQFQIPQSGKVEVVLQVINEVTSNMKATEGNSPGRRMGSTVRHGAQGEV